MRTTLFSLIFTATASLAAMAPAATLGLTTGAPSLSSSAASIDYFEFGSDGDLSSFGAEIDATNGITTTGFTEIGFGIGFSLSDPTDAPAGGFDIFDDTGLVLAGDLLAIGFVEDTIELQFNNLFGSGAGAFGTSALAVITFDDPLGPDPFLSFFDGDFYGASITVSNVVSTTPSPVPLPAGLPLMLGALGLSAGLLRRRKN